MGAIILIFFLIKGKNLYIYIYVSLSWAGETSGVADETAENTAAVQDAVAVQDVAAAKN